MATARKATKKSAKATVKKPVARKLKTTTVDYYPNRMTFWVSAAAGSLLVLMAVMVVYS